MTDAWMPGAQRVPATADGGRMKGGAPRAVWLVLYANPLLVSARAAAERLIRLGRPCHLVWNPLSTPRAAASARVDGINSPLARYRRPS